MLQDPRIVSIAGNMMTLQKYTKYVNASTLLIFLLAILSLASIHAIRYYSHDSILAGEESYFLTRLADYFSINNKLLGYDNLSNSGRLLSYQQASPIIISLFSSLFQGSTLLSCSILSMLLGIIVLLAFYFIIIKTVQNRKTAQLSTFFLAISPPFLYTFSTCNIHMMPIAIIFLGILSLLYSKKFFSILLFILLPFFSTIYSFIGLIFVFTNTFLRKNQKWPFFTILSANILSIILLNINLIRIYGLPELLNFKVTELGLNFAFQNFIAEFGSIFGISVFSLILAFSGFSVLWSKKYEYANIYIVTFIFLLLAIYLVWPVILLNFMIIMLASVGLFNLIKIKWESKLIRNLTITLLISGMILTSLLHINKISNMNPNQDIIDSLEVLNAESNPGDIVLSHPSNGYWIESIASRPTFIDSNFVYSPDINMRYSDMQTIFQSRSAEEVSQLLNKYNIKYIWVTADMKSGKVWETEDQGLLFLLKYNTNFKKLFSNSNTELYWYKGELQ